MTCSVSHETSHRNTLPYSLTNACRTHVRVTNGCVVSWSCCGQWTDELFSRVELRVQEKRDSAGHLSLSLCFVLSLPPQLCACSSVPRFYFWSFFCASVLPQQGLIWPDVLDLMSSWPSGISRFASSINPCSRLTRFGDFTRLCLKKKK